MHHMRTDHRQQESDEPHSCDLSRSPHPSSSLSVHSDMAHDQELVWWRSPFHIIFYFALECVYQLNQTFRWLLQHIFYLILLIAVVGLHFTLRAMTGSHQAYVEQVEKKIVWCVYWMGLGVLSSIGLGSGLHTFVLYLGPHIAAVTLAAHECGSLNFPEPPYPDEIICPTEKQAGEVISLLSIMAKVRLEAFMWGAGTALGELPPYFLARARSLSLSEETETGAGEDDSKVGQVIQKIIQKAGFIGILACASIPNPLFDLAGITCGHFLVPFWTFFGATLIGKAVIKMMLQKTFVILAFNEQYVLKVIELLRSVPVVGEKVGQLVQSGLAQQKASLHRNPAEAKESGWLSWAFQTFITVVIISFVCSLINILAQNYINRRRKEQQDRNRGKKK